MTGTEMLWAACVVVIVGCFLGGSWALWVWLGPDDDEAAVAEEHRKLDALARASGEASSWQA